MEFVLGFLTITLITVLAVISPGPDTAVVIKNSLLKSRRDGVATTLGIVLGNAFYVSLVLFGLGAIIASSAVLFSVIKYCGALYLVYVGIKLLLSKKTILEQGAVHGSASSFSVSFREGVLTNFSNPKFMLFLLALFTQVISPATPLVIQALYVYQIPLIAFAWFSILALVLTMPAVRSKLSSFMHHVERITGVVLIGFGIKVALSANH